MKQKEHKFNKNILLYSFLILMILIMLIYSGIMLYDNYKKKQIQDDFSLLNQQIVLNDLYNSYLEDVNSQEKKCEILNKQILQQMSFNQELYERLYSINKNAIVPSDNNLKYMYVLTNIKLWLHYKQVNKECNLNFKTMLYFYPEVSGIGADKFKTNAKTKIFERKLTNISKKCNIKSFAIPYLDYIPLVDQMIDDFNITKAPAAYINNKVYYDIPKDTNQEFLDGIDCDLS